MIRSVWFLSWMMTFKILAVLALLAQITASAIVELTDENWLENVQGKSVFIFFDEDENEDCRALDDTWERLADDWEGHEVGLVAHVDCDSDDTEVLCEEYGIVSLPLLLYGDPESPEFYENKDRSYATLSAFAKKHLSSPPCNIKNLHHCGETERKILSDLLEKSRAELDAMEEEADAQIAQVERKFDAKIADIQAQYKSVVAEFNTELEKARKESNYKWLQQVLHHWDEQEEQEEL